MLYFLFNFFFKEDFICFLKKIPLKYMYAMLLDQNLLIILLLLTLSCDFDFWWVFLEVLRRMMILVPSVCWKCWKGRACWNVKMAAKIVYIIIAYQSVCTTVDVAWNMRFISPLVLLVSFFLFLFKREHTFNIIIFW